MSLVRINDDLDITITNDDEFKKAMDLFSHYLNTKSNSNSDSIEEECFLNEIKIMDLENAMKLYKGDYFIIE